MRDEIKKKIEEKIADRYEKTDGPVQAIYRYGAEFGYQLGYEEAMKELTRQAIDANSVKPVFDRAMASESKEPKP